MSESGKPCHCHETLPGHSWGFAEIPSEADFDKLLSAIGPAGSTGGPGVVDLQNLDAMLDALSATPAAKVGGGTSISLGDLAESLSGHPGLKITIGY